ncbi:hypothetical protein [Qipengyuania sp. MTN3-11]|uniref:hypothetical protein n=1 Tax=Qipengyuania sp. MTN3-11 TaxID=3056557 RepID=UPI0036F1F7C1
MTSISFKYAAALQEILEFVENGGLPDIETMVASVAGLTGEVSKTDLNATLSGTAAGDLLALDGSAKVPSALLPSEILNSLRYRGTWNATTNVRSVEGTAMPSANGSNKGHYYVVSTAGSTNLDGITDWKVGDWVISNGSTYDKIDNTDLVTSVAGLQGVISAADLRTALGALQAASTAEIRAHNGSGGITATGTANALVAVALSDATTTALDWTAGINFTWTASGNRTLGNPSNALPGTQRTIYLLGNNATARTITFGTNYKGALPTLSDVTSTKGYLLTIHCLSTTHFVVTAVQAL